MEGLQITESRGFRVGDTVTLSLVPGVEFFVAPGGWMLIPKPPKRDTSHGEVGHE